MEKLKEKELNELTKEELVNRCLYLEEKLKEEKYLSEIYKRGYDLFESIKTIAKCVR